MTTSQITKEIERAKKAIVRAEQTKADNEALIVHYETMLKGTTK